MSRTGDFDHSSRSLAHYGRGWWSLIRQHGRNKARRSLSDDADEISFGIRLQDGNLVHLQDDNLVHSQMTI
jgi:hypothetical protein